MFGFNFDKRIVYIILAIFVLANLSAFATNPQKLESLVLALPAILIAITFHEFAHAFAADKLGDDTPRRQGRLTLNPLAHLDPIGSIMLLLLGFGWGKPVEINTRNFNRNRSMSAGEAIVSVAGPLMNFLLAIVFSIITGIILMSTNSYLRFGVDGIVYISNASEVVVIILKVVLNCILINLSLGIFNLIPLPPLDGSKILRNFLPYKAKGWMDRNWQILYIVFVIIWITPLAEMIISPILGSTYRLLSKFVIGMFGRVL